LRPGSNQVLFNGANGVLPIRSSDYRIELQLDDPAVQQLSTILTFMNGRQETLMFNRAPGAQAQARFLFELREDADWDELTFLALHVQPLGGVSADGSLSARLCKVKSDEDRPGLRTAQAGGK
jgi:alginate biosynthesis protein AlgX